MPGDQAVDPGTGRAMKPTCTFFVSFLVVFAAGCATSPATPAMVRDEVAKVLEDCRGKWESGLYAGLHESTDKCVNPRLNALFRKFRYPYPDLVELIGAYRLKVSRAIDNNELSYADGKLLMAQLGVAIESEEQKRASLSAQERAVASRNDAHILQTMAIYQTVVAPRTIPLVNCATTTGETTCR